MLCGDVGNAFVTALCLEKVYSRAGLEFGDCHDSIMVLMKALYGLQSSSCVFHGHFAGFLHSMGFRSICYDCDVWMQMCEDKTGYDYICTHVDDFKIVAHDPNRWLTQISAVFLFKSTGPPSYYLGNDYVWSTSEKTPTVFVWSTDYENPGSMLMPTFDPADLIGRTFLLPPEDNSERHGAKVTRKVVEISDQENGHRIENINFLLDLGNGKVEELISYNKLLDDLETAQGNDLGMDQESLDIKVL